MNGRRDDNRKSNLCVMKSHAHDRYHDWYDWVVNKCGKPPRKATQLKKLTEELGGILLEQPRSDFSRRSSLSFSNFRRFKRRPRLLKFF